MQPGQSSVPPPSPRSEGAITGDHERLARRFHEVYTLLAPDFGWDVQEGTDGSFDALPPKNRALMEATCAFLLRERTVEVGPLMPESWPR